MHQLSEGNTSSPGDGDRASLVALYPRTAPHRLLTGHVSLLDPHENALASILSRSAWLRCQSAGERSRLTLFLSLCFYFFSFLFFFFFCCCRSLIWRFDLSLFNHPRTVFKIDFVSGFLNVILNKFLGANLIRPPVILLFFLSLSLALSLSLSLLQHPVCRYSGFHQPGLPVHSPGTG